jgi:soluble lytic murein transglycosylase
MLLCALIVGVPVAILIWTVRFAWVQAQRARKYDSQIVAAATRYRIDPLLVKAVIWQESRFDQFARGKAGEIGLMQIMEESALEWAEAEKMKDFSQARLWDASSNIYAGTFYLSKLLKRYTNTDNPLPYALADYNAGRTHVLRWNKGAARTNSQVFLAQMDYPGTRKYALSIMKQYEHYRQKAQKSVNSPTVTLKSKN